MGELMNFFLFLLLLGISSLFWVCFREAESSRSGMSAPRVEVIGSIPMVGLEHRVGFRVQRVLLRFLILNATTIKHITCFANIY